MEAIPVQSTLAGRRVALGYLIFAHVALAAAATALICRAPELVGFFYTPRTIAVVHALTLGWISSSLVGLLYLHGPLRPGRLDGWLLGTWILGTSGLISHFWLAEFHGLSWSAGLLGIAVTILAARFSATIVRSDLPGPARLQIQLAWVNLLATAFIGLLLGVNKTTTILPGYSLHNVFAHAHLAALGWAVLLILALTTMQARTANISGSAIGIAFAATAAIQLGAAGLFVALFTGEPLTVPFGMLAVAGVALGQFGVLAERRATLRSASGVLQIVALLWFATAALLGLRLALAGGRADAPQTILIYGVAALLGGLGSWVAGLLLHESSTTFGRRWLATACWIGAPLTLIAGLAYESTGAVRLGAALLLPAIGTTIYSLLRPTAVAR